MPFTLTVDGLNRTVHVRDPGTSPHDAVISLHPRNSLGSTFLTNKIAPSDDRIDFAPDALVMGDGKTRWVAPGDASRPWYPAIPTDGLTDVRLVDALCDYIAANYPSVQRIYVWGYSSGCKLAWTLYAYNQSHAEQVVAYAGTAWGMPDQFDWVGKTKTTRPFSLWWGTNDPGPAPADQETYTPFATSVAALRTQAGCTAPGTVEGLGGCGSGKTLDRRKGVSCTQPVWEYRHNSGGHEWPTYSTCRADVRFEELFALSGYGT